MSRSYRKPAHYTSSSANPKRGKLLTNRALRRTVRQVLHIDKEDFDFVHPQDKNRGNAGSRSVNYGWDNFGDGRQNPYCVEHTVEDDEDRAWFESLKRK